MAEATTIDVAEEAEAETATTRSQMEKHEGFVSWYDENYAPEGESLSDYEPAVVIAEFARLRNEFRRSEFYLSQWGPEAREAARLRREELTEQRRVEREAARAAKAAEKAAAKEAAEKEAAEAGETEGEDGAKPKAKTRTRKRAATRKASPSAIVVDETDSGEDVDEDEAFD